MIFGFLTFLALLGLSNATLDPEIKMSVTEIIQRWGYPAEEMDAITEDNYILTMHRIPYGKDGIIPHFPFIINARFFRPKCEQTRNFPSTWTRR